MKSKFYLPVKDSKVQIVAYVPRAKRSAYNELASLTPYSLAQTIELLLDEHFADNLAETTQKFLPAS